jgi:hypothetical protein
MAALPLRYLRGTLAHALCQGARPTLEKVSQDQQQVLTPKFTELHG